VLDVFSAEHGRRRASFSPMPTPAHRLPEAAEGREKGGWRSTAERGVRAMEQPPRRERGGRGHQEDGHSLLADAPSE
jgi:hypothetical protein